jgi:hypothetical protein
VTRAQEKRSHSFADAKFIWGSANSVQNLAQKQLRASSDDSESGFRLGLKSDSRLEPEEAGCNDATLLFGFARARAGAV